MSALSVRLPLQTERLVLRTHRAEDLDDLVVFHGDPEVVRYVPWPLRDRTATEQTLRVSADEIAEGAARCSSEVREAIAFAAARIRAYHERQRPADQRFVDDVGVELGWRWTPLEAVGLYVPGGRAAYPSTVLMNAVPAATPPGRQWTHRRYCGPARTPE